MILVRLIICRGPQLGPQYLSTPISNEFGMHNSRYGWRSYIEKELSTGKTLSLLLQQNDVHNNIK